MKRIFFVTMILTAVACAPPPVRPGTGTRKESNKGNDYGPEIGRAAYEDLVTAARKYHVFTRQTEENLGFTWEERLPEIEKEFSRISSRAELVRAIRHFANSLHNPHCYYHSPGRPSRLTPGFDIEVEWIEDKPRFYVHSIVDKDLAKRIQAGDRLVEYQGVDQADFLNRFHAASNGNNWRSIAFDIAWFFSRQTPQRNATRPGSKATWKFQRPGTKEIVSVNPEWKPVEAAASRTEFGIPYDPESCAGLPKRNYGDGYKLAEVGANFCAYASFRGKGRHVPVVRQFSFSYGSRNNFSALRADRRNIEKFLGGIPDAKGVILDLRDNRGGNNPNWFLDWWAPGSYKNYMVYNRLHEDFDTEEKLRKANITGWGPPHFQRYLKALAEKPPGTQFMDPRPFFCPTPDCKNFDNVYHPKNQVTKLPVAILLGPLCVSSCDDVARTFLEYDLGPVVGVAGASGLTVTRLQHKVRHPHSGEDLGFVALAFSYETSGKTGERLEAVVMPPDRVVEPTFANRDRYDELLVNTAIESLGGFRFPARK